jgi:GH24 family phage-related lysozyme (muramidase)
MYIMRAGFEGLRLTAYRDIAGVQTIGHRPHRREFETITADQACQERLLQAADRSDTFTPVYRNFRKINNI